MNEADGSVYTFDAAANVWTPFEIFRDPDPQVDAGGYTL